MPIISKSIFEEEEEEEAEEAEEADESRLYIVTSSQHFV